MKVYHLFAGGGGGLLADHLLGHEPVGACEIEDAPRALLAKRWNGISIHRDICELTGAEVIRDCGLVDVISGGWPCQDISVAGKQAGMAMGSGTRSSLAHEYLRIIKEVQPRFVFGENVANIVSKAHRPALDEFLSELSALGYGGAWCILSAAQAGAPHLRKRFWLLAERGLTGFREVSTKHLPAWPHPASGFTRPTPDVCGLNNRVGVSGKSGDGLGWAAKADTSCGELWATARVSGSGTEDFVRDDGKLRDDLQTMVVMAECVTGGDAWPTPRADKTTEEEIPSWLARHEAGKVSTPPLSTAAAMEEVARVNPAPSPWPTVTVQDGENAAGPSQFSRNTLPLNAEVFREMVRGMTPEQVKAIIGDRRLNPAWVENLMGWPVGWTDMTVGKPRVPVGTGGEYLFPSGRWVAQRPHEPARITSVKARSTEAKARNAALRMLGNGQVPQCAAMAWRILFSALPRSEIKGTH